MKPCRSCGAQLPLTDFDRDRRNTDGRTNVCKPCRADRARGKYEGKLRHRAGALYQRARYRAEKKGLDFDLTVDWVEDALRAGTCQATGVPFDMSLGHVRNLYAPSLDKVDPSGGYTQDNTKVVLYAYNAAKSTASDAEVRQFFKRVAEALA
jgi:hypothetical protein